MTFKDANLYQRLTGEPFPLTFLEGESPQLTVEEQDRLVAFSRLALNPDFVLFVEFAREQAAKALKKRRSDTATDFALRAAKAGEEFVSEFGPMVVEEIKALELKQTLHEEWLELKSKNQLPSDNKSTL